MQSSLLLFAGVCRWNFVQGESGLQSNRLSARHAASSKLYRRKLQKRLMHHKQQLLDLQQAKKHFFTAQVWHYRYLNNDSRQCPCRQNPWVIFRWILCLCFIQCFDDVVVICCNMMLWQEGHPTPKSCVAYPVVLFWNGWRWKTEGSRLTEFFFWKIAFKIEKLVLAVDCSLFVL